MKNGCFAFLFCLVAIGSVVNAQPGKEKAVREVLKRVTGRTDLPIKLALKQDKGGAPLYFQYQVNNDQLYIQGSTPVALCRGFYDFIKSNRCGLYSWSGNNMVFPHSLPQGMAKRIVSPFEHHYYLNVVTYGYSMPYWDWTRWEQEIDWMALHGIDMPLALVAYEAIVARVWEKMGLTKEEINHYFVGPAHLPWMRMGNISGIDGPLPEEWHRGQVRLQHQILNRMRDLGMKPICPGFAGFVPRDFKRIHPELNLITTHWGGAFSNWMISPDEPLFAQISTAFIEEWEKEFGKNERYLVDSFNEMEVPFPAKGTQERYRLLASYGDKVYQSIKKANPDAIWVMQGWMFGYQRHIWDYETLEALVSKVPDEKMLLLDLAVDYNKHFWHSEVNWEFYKGFYNKPWVYSVIPNMGGKTGLTGVLEFYANGHLEALPSPNKGRLEAYGFAPEGIENNEVIYELCSDAGWSNQEIDLDNWLEDYSWNRYGAYPDGVRNCWALLQQSVYGSFTDHPRYNWQFRPGTVAEGSIKANDLFFAAVENFVEAAPEMPSSQLYKTDVAELTALYLGGKIELLVNLIDQCYQQGDTLAAIGLEKDFEHLMLGVDRLLSAHPTLRLERWLDFAHRQSLGVELKSKYESNARRIVTIWGPPVDDYSARVWSGLVRDYYLPRWQNYFEARKKSERFDFAAWERDWVERLQPLSKADIPVDVVATAKELVAYASVLPLSKLAAMNDQKLGFWALDRDGEERFEFSVPAGKLPSMKGIQVLKRRGKGQALVAEVSLFVDGVPIFKTRGDEVLGGDNPLLTIPIHLPVDVKANNGCQLKIVLRGVDLAGEVLLLEK